MRYNSRYPMFQLFAFCFLALMIGCLIATIATVGAHATVYEKQHKKVKTFPCEAQMMKEDMVRVAYLTECTESGMVIPVSHP